MNGRNIEVIILSNKWKAEEVIKIMEEMEYEEFAKVLDRWTD